MFYSNTMNTDIDAIAIDKIESAIEALKMHRDDLEMRINHLVAVYDAIEDIIDSYKVHPYHTTDTLYKHSIMIKAITDKVEEMLKTL